MSNDFPYYWICFECAKARGAVWPEGHVATMTEITCKYCNGKNQKEIFIAPWVDYNWPNKNTTKMAEKLRD